MPLLRPVMLNVPFQHTKISWLIIVVVSRQKTLKCTLCAIVRSGIDFFMFINVKIKKFINLNGSFFYSGIRPTIPWQATVCNAFPSQV
jgi:hypothetical protein